MSDLIPDEAGQQTARLVLQMDAAISAFRAGRSSGVHALDTVSQLGRGALDEATTGSDARTADRRVPGRPSQTELAVLTALADTYGAEMLTNASLGYVLRLVARNGGVSLVKRVLFGESASDQQLSVMLTSVRAEFGQISSVFAGEFFAEANALIAGFRPRPPQA